MPNTDARFQEALSAAANALQAATLLVAMRRREPESPQEAVQLEAAVLRAAQAIRWLQQSPAAVRPAR